MLIENFEKWALLVAEGGKLSTNLHVKISLQMATRMIKDEQKWIPNTGY
jgi:hypothetical protein